MELVQYSNISTYTKSILNISSFLRSWLVKLIYPISEVAKLVLLQIHFYFG